MIPATLYHGQIPLILTDAEPALAPYGILDTLEWEILCHRASWASQLAALGLVYRKPVLEYPTMWVQSATPKNEDGTHCIVSVSAIGTIDGGEKRQRVIGSAGQQIALGPVEGKRWADPFGTESDKWSIRDRILTVTDTYFTGQQPSTAVVGTALAPPLAPGSPAFLWGHLDLSWRANYPKGWVLDDRQIIEHFKDTSNVRYTPGLWEVRDTFGFYHVASPE